MGIKKTMKISNVPPPVYDLCVKKFGVDFNQGFVFTYGDTVHTKFPLPSDLIVHESVHIKQQGTKPEEWWDKYLADRDFRLSQEVEAYSAQYQFFARGTDRNLAYRFLLKIAGDLSVHYDLGISKSEAALLIKGK
jgi:hypothetical protein